MNLLKLSILGLILISFQALASPNELPNPLTTPGDVRPGITSKDLCPVAHTSTVRNVPQSLKEFVYNEYSIKPHQGYCSGPQGCEVDHLISLELGGSNDIKNLWPEPYGGVTWNAHVKDKLENKLHELVCEGKADLVTAQKEISTNWIEAYKKYIGDTP